MVSISSLLSLSQDATYPLPDVPASLTDPADRAAYVVENFWEKADLSHALDSDSVKLEQSFVDFISIFPYTESPVVTLGINNLLDKSSFDISLYRKVVRLAEKYLYNVDSPLKEDEYYIPFLANYLESSLVKDSDKLRQNLQYDFVLKNRKGEKAADFGFELRDGTKSSLYDITSPNDLLLIFYDPDCDNCKKTMSRIQTDAGLQEKVKTKEMTVLAVYSGDEKELWDRTKMSLPDEWIVGYEDGTIQDEDIYILRMQPTLYLLDSDKKVKRKEFSIL